MRPRGMRTRIKICGITNKEDAEIAIEAGADALGFNFYTKSARFINPNLANEVDWLHKMPPFVCRVGVMVNPQFNEVLQIYKSNLVDAIQLHGEEDESFCKQLVKSNIPFIKAIRVQNNASLDGIAEKFSTESILLDSYNKNVLGGSGKTFDWEIARKFSDSTPKVRLILSGGLTSKNIREAITAVNPYAVDVASGVEYKTDKRKKDPIELMKFVHEVNCL